MLVHGVNGVEIIKKLKRTPNSTYATTGEITRTC